MVMEKPEVLSQGHEEGQLGQLHVAVHEREMPVFIGGY
jgi:hypothetical protein